MFCGWTKGKATCGIKLAAITAMVKIPMRPTCRLIQVSTEKGGRKRRPWGLQPRQNPPKLGLDASDPACSPRQVIASVADSIAILDASQFPIVSIIMDNAETCRSTRNHTRVVDFELDF